MSNVPILVDPVNRAILELITLLTAHWQEFRSEKISSTSSEALKLLVGAGMVERRDQIRLRMIGFAPILFVKFRVTGEYGLVEVVDKITAAVSEWMDEQGKPRGQFLCETSDITQMRLTDQGELAKIDISENQFIRVVEFVRKTGFFQNYPFDRGHGIVESLEIQKSSVSDTMPTQVVATASAQASIGDITIQNNIQLDTDALATAIGKALAAALSTQRPQPTEGQAPIQASAATNIKAKTSPPKRSWTAADLNEAIREYRAKRASRFSELLSILDDPTSKPSEKVAVRKAAAKLFGRNVIARELGVKSARMVSESPAWKAIAESFGLKRKSRERTAKPNKKIGLDIALEKSSLQQDTSNDYASAEASLLIAEREITLKAIRQFAQSASETGKQQAKAILDKYNAGDMTDEQVRQTLNMMKKM